MLLLVCLCVCDHTQVAISLGEEPETMLIPI